MFMSVTQISVQRCSIVSSKPFDQILKSLESVLGHPDMKAFMSAVTAAKDLPELEEIIHHSISSGESADHERDGGPRTRCRFLRAGYGVDR
jgi:hypothetical protein